MWSFTLTIILLAVPRGNEKKRGQIKEKKGTEINSQDVGPIEVSERKDGTEGYTHTK